MLCVLQVDPGNTASDEQLPHRTFPMSSASVISCQANSGTVLSESKPDISFYARSANSTKDTYSIKSKDDFPSLAHLSSPCSESPNSPDMTVTADWALKHICPNGRSRTKLGGCKQEENETDHPGSLRLEAFEDAEGHLESARDELAVSVSGSGDSAQPNSQNLPPVTAADQAFIRAVNDAGNSSFISDVNSTEEPGELAAVPESEAKSTSARLEQSPSVHNTSNGSSLTEPSHGSRVADQSTVFDFGDIDYDDLKGADAALAMLPCNDVQQASEDLRVPGSLVNSLPADCICASKSKAGRKISKVDGPLVDVQQASEDLRMPGSLGDSLPKDGTCASKSKAASKIKKTWKLDGPLVVQVENVPKNRGKELKTHLEAFGKVLNSEKKSKKGANVWRFRFVHQIHIMYYYTVEPTGLSVRLQNSNSVQLSRTQTRALQAEMHHCIEKSFLYCVSKFLERSVDSGSSRTPFFRSAMRGGLVRTWD